MGNEGSGMRILVGARKRRCCGRAAEGIRRFRRNERGGELQTSKFQLSISAFPVRRALFGSLPLSLIRTLSVASRVPSEV